ncbi:MAG: hypothetical protein IKO75_12635 [Bacteroidales bacterium]|nr:hypothetical protein [Bacteroidales bacterium]
MLKLLVVILVLAALDILYYFTLYQKDIEENCTLMALSERAADGVDIVYLGESSNHTYSDSDTDKRFICEMIDDLLPNHHVGNLAKDACHAGVYYDILRNIPRSNGVKTAIVTVNLRSFTSEWIYSNLEPALRKEQIMMKKAPALYKRTLLAFKAYPQWSEKERSSLVRNGFKRQTFSLPHPSPYHNANDWDRAIGGSFTLFNGTQPSMDTIALACHYIKNFACTLDDNNPRIKDLDKIVRLCKQRGWQPVFNILAENVDQIDSICGPDLLGLMERNTQYITNRYEPKGVIVVNNLKEVRDADFRDRDFPTEHYRQTGRLSIAKNVAHSIN